MGVNLECFWSREHSDWIQIRRNSYSRMICPNLLKNFISSYVKTAFTECLCDNPAHRFRRTNDVTLPSRNLKYLSKTENPAYKKTELNISCQNCFNSRLHNFQTNTDNLLILLLISSSPLRRGMETASYTRDLPPFPTGREAAGGRQKGRIDQAR